MDKCSRPFQRWGMISITLLRYLEMCDTDCYPVQSYVSLQAVIDNNSQYDILSVL
jgi:hypothetical protein